MSEFKSGTPKKRGEYLCYQPSKGNNILDSADLSRVLSSTGKKNPYIQEIFDCIGEVCDHRGIWVSQHKISQRLGHSW